MQCISTLAVMRADDPELAAARRRFAAHLADAGAPPDCPEGIDAWTYRCSIPRRRDDDAIGYLHVFQHNGRIAAGANFSLGVAASPGWWPVGCPSLAPPRQAQRRPALRLVS
jgi:hypothetical protein